MPTSAANGCAKGRDPREGPQADDDVPAQHDSAESSGLVEEAQALRRALRDASSRASRLVVTLQRQRKHAKLLATTLTSLRQLQHFDL